MRMNPFIRTHEVQALDRGPGQSLRDTPVDIPHVYKLVICIVT